MASYHSSLVMLHKHLISWIFGVLISESWPSTICIFISYIQSIRSQKSKIVNEFVLNLSIFSIRGHPPSKTSDQKVTFWIPSCQTSSVWKTTPPPIPVHRRSGRIARKRLQNAKYFAIWTSVNGRGRMSDSDTGFETPKRPAFVDARSMADSPPHPWSSTLVHTPHPLTLFDRTSLMDGPVLVLLIDTSIFQPTTKHNFIQCLIDVSFVNLHNIAKIKLIIFCWE